MYVFTFPVTLVSDDGRSSRYEYASRLAQDREEAIKLMMALVRLKMMYFITTGDGHDVSAEEIIPRRDFWKRYFAAVEAGYSREDAARALRV